MNQIEFKKWFRLHRAAFASVDSWIAKMSQRGGDDDSQLLSLKKKVSKSEPLSPSGPTDYPAMSSRDYS